MSAETKELSNNLLKEKMVDAVVTRNYPENLDVVKQPGVYQVGASTLTGLPEPGVYGTMTVVASIAFLTQTIHSRTGVMYSRTTNSTDPWPAWRKFQGSVL